MNNSPQIKRFVLAAVAIIILVAGIVSVQQLTNRHGQLDLVFTVPDLKTLSVKLNDKTLAVENYNPTYAVKDGSYTLTISKQGYTTLTASLTIQNGKQVIVNAALQHQGNTTLSSWSQVQGYNALAPGANLSQVSYFYQQTWAVLTISIGDGDSGTVVVRYDDTIHNWVAVLGPGTLFTSGNLVGLPSQVATYMNTNNYIGN